MTRGRLAFRERVAWPLRTGVRWRASNAILVQPVVKLECLLALGTVEGDPGTILRDELAARGASRRRGRRIRHARTALVRPRRARRRRAAQPVQRAGGAGPRPRATGAGSVRGLAATHPLFGRDKPVKSHTRDLAADVVEGR